MQTIVGVRFKKAGKIYYFDPGELALQKGEPVIVETARGLEYGLVVIPARQIEDTEVASPLKPVLRKATEKDTLKVADNEAKEAEALRICAQKIAAHKLDMNLVSVEYTFDVSKIIFYFTAEGRVDFRELVKDLAGIFRTRIELRQIGVRDESKMLGGLGICGQPFCCSRFLTDFQPVSIKMAKEQGLSLNPTKISGACGRLMCCLAYEQPAYEFLTGITPGVTSYVHTPDGDGTVCEVNVISGNLRVRLDKSPDLPKTYHRDQVALLRAASKKGSRRKGVGAVPPPQRAAEQQPAPATAAAPAAPPAPPVPEAAPPAQQRDAAPKEESGNPKPFKRRRRGPRRGNKPQNGPAQGRTGCFCNNFNA